MTISAPPVSVSAPGAQAAARRVPFLAACGAALLGVLILFGVGFAQPRFAHNAAHDARHAQGFPCH